MPRLPPGPSNRALTTYRILAQPFEWIPRWRDRYGDPFLLHAMNGDVVMTGQPELVRQIFRADPSFYAPFAVEAAGPLVGQNAVLLTKGEQHKRDRKLLMPAFHGERMRTYAELMRDITRRTFDRAATLGGSHDMLELAQAISLDVIIEAVFGVAEAERVAEFHASIIRFVAAFAPSLSFTKHLQRDWWPAWRRFRTEAAHLDGLLYAQIDSTRERGLGEDILSLLIGARYDDGEAMPDHMILDQLRTLLFAGHETTAVTLAWIADLLWRDPAALDRARAEALGPAPDAAARELAELPFIEAVCKETLRMRPVTTEVLRVLEKPMELGGFELQPGMAVSPSISLVHTNPEIYPEPHRFAPERFLGKRYAAYEYLPFGGGHRRCIGAAFASFEMQLVLATLLREYELELVAEPAQLVRRNVTMAPSPGVPVRVRRVDAADDRRVA